jgi:hypothetical protein
MDQHPSWIDLPQQEKTGTMARLSLAIIELLQRVLPTRRMLKRAMMWSLPVVVIATPSWWMSRRLFASDFDSRRATPDSPLLRETRLTLKARQALFEDSLLAPYNIGVIVHGDVATLQGTLPKTALALRAQDRLRGLSLFKEVRSALVIDPNGDLSTSEPFGAKPRPSGDLTGRNVAPAQVPVLKITVPEVNDVAPTNPTEKPPLSDAVSLLPPRPIPDVKNSPADSPTPPPTMDPSEAVETLRRSDKRFLPLQVTVREGVVTVHGAGDELFAFAQAIRRVPGVLRVVVDPSGR